MRVYQVYHRFIKSNNYRFSIFAQVKNINIFNFYTVTGDLKGQARISLVVYLIKLVFASCILAPLMHSQWILDTCQI